jgi:hypothetical protein
MLFLACNKDHQKASVKAIEKDNTTESSSLYFCNTCLLGHICCRFYERYVDYDECEHLANVEGRDHINHCSNVYTFLTETPKWATLDVYDYYIYRALHYWKSAISGGRSYLEEIE